MDKLTRAKRSWNMSRIKGKDTEIEVMVRKYLFSLGFRYRKNDRRYPGKPDIVLPKYKTVIYVNGCFWHMHKNCKQGRLPKTNIEFWKSKLEKNVYNDQQNIQKLEAMGWKAITLWECELEKDFNQIMKKTTQELLSSL